MLRKIDSDNDISRDIRDFLAGNLSLETLYSRYPAFSFHDLTTYISMLTDRNQQYQAIRISQQKLPLSRQENFYLLVIRPFYEAISDLDIKHYPKARSLLHWAILYDQPLSEVQFAKKICPHAITDQDSQGYTALHYTALKSRTDILQWLASYPELFTRQLVTTSGLTATALSNKILYLKSRNHPAKKKKQFLTIIKNRQWKHAADILPYLNPKDHLQLLPLILLRQYKQTLERFAFFEAYQTSEAIIQICESGSIEAFICLLIAIKKRTFLNDDTAPFLNDAIIPHLPIHLSWPRNVVTFTINIPSYTKAIQYSSTLFNLIKEQFINILMDPTKRHLLYHLAMDYNLSLKELATFLNQYPSLSTQTPIFYLSSKEDLEIFIIRSKTLSLEKINKIYCLDISQNQQDYLLIYFSQCAAHLRQRLYIEAIIPYFKNENGHIDFEKTDAKGRSFIGWTQYFSDTIMLVNNPLFNQITLDLLNCAIKQQIWETAETILKQCHSNKTLNYFSCLPIIYATSTHSISSEEQEKRQLFLSTFFNNLFAQHLNPDFIKQPTFTLDTLYHFLLLAIQSYRFGPEAGMIQLLEGRNKVPPKVLKIYQLSKQALRTPKLEDKEIHLISIYEILNSPIHTQILSGYLNNNPPPPKETIAFYCFFKKIFLYYQKHHVISQIQDIKEPHLSPVSSYGLS